MELQGRVEVALSGGTTWSAAQTNQALHAGDHLRTGPNSRAAVSWSSQSVVPIDALTEIEILAPHTTDADYGLHLIRGIVSWFHRDAPGHLRIITRGAAAGVEGTEFVLAVNDADLTTLSVIDGRVSFGNEQGKFSLTNGEQAVASPGQAPARTPGFIANNLLQWSFYYPAVIDAADLQFPSGDEKTLASSFESYRAGDLLAALANYPSGRQPASDIERVYLAELLLSVGRVDEAETTLGGLPAGDPNNKEQRLANALRGLIAAVKREPNPASAAPTLASEFLAQSYYAQSRAQRDASLHDALRSARQATVLSPRSGFAWERVAELEFSFGHIGAAAEALDKSLSLSPRNAQALALKGFLLAGQNKTHEAVTWFDRSIAVDSALGNAWLGRGLCRIHKGDSKGGQEDLLVAAALEPQRSELRSYLGKAFAVKHDDARATKELHLAEHLDPNDPTPWLYSALLNQERNRINEGVRDLEKSQELNNNRSVYRSQFLLDQDQAVRSANLAGLYADAGMFDVSVREAARAVNSDYANYSAHLFLADSFGQLRDPNKVNLRYETPAKSEYLIANLLAPVSAGTLSPTLSQEEYSKLFAQNHIGVVSATEYLSRGAWAQSGAQYGNFGDFSYSLDGFYRFDPGQRRNNDIEERQLSLTFRQQITPQDSIYLRVGENELSGGDLAQYYRQGMANAHLRIDEKQLPVLNFGYHHEWDPNIHTLFLFNWINDDATFSNPTQPTLVTFRPDLIAMPGVTHLTGVTGLTMNERLKGRFNLYSGELQQIWESGKHTTIIGSRFQYGCFRTENFQDMPSTIGNVFPDPPTPAADQDITSSFERFSVYAYHHWKILEPVELVGGLTYDHMMFPENFRIAPVSSRQKTIDDLLPKVGVILTPARDTTIRFAYTRSLAGASLDQSYQLEPSQVAGFVQSFRSIIPESVAGANAGAEFETFNLSIEQKFKTGTYLGLSGEILNSQVHRVAGAFDVLPDQFDFAMPSGLREHLNYEEKSVQFTINQLLSQEWALGARYRASWADLKDNFVDVPDGLIFVNFQPRQHVQGFLQQLDLYAIYNSPCGFFARGDALWRSQENHGHSLAEPGDDFWQFNAMVGYRSRHRRVEASIALLNITNEEYRLSPLNLYDELPHERTLAFRLQFNF